MKHLFLAASALFVCVSVCAGLVACGDDDSNTISVSARESVATADDLEECGKNFERRVLFVEEDSTYFFCNGQKWIEIKDENIVLDTDSGASTKSSSSKAKSSSSVKGDSKSSNSKTGSSSSGKTSSSSSATSSSSSGKNSSSSKAKLEKCGTKEYDAQKQFCKSDSIYDLCNGKTYDPAEKVCISNVLIGWCFDEKTGDTPYLCVNDASISSCGDKLYDYTKQFCVKEKLYDFCGGKTFDPELTVCVKDSVAGLCGENKYDLKKQFCVKEKLYDLCGGKEFNPDSSYCTKDAHSGAAVVASYYGCCGKECASGAGKIYELSKDFCYENEVYPLCADKEFDVSKQFCLNESLVDLCGGKTFDLSKQFCQKDALYDLCGGKQYDPSKQFCLKNGLQDLCGGKSYNPDSSYCKKDAGEESVENLYKCCYEGRRECLLWYNVQTEYCSDKEVYPLCGDTWYDPESQACVNGFPVDVGEAKPNWSYLNSKISYGLMQDTRDNQFYKTVKIGDQVWMAENLNYATVGGNADAGKTSWCGGGEGEKEGDCSLYGRLYTWSAAVNMPDDECGYEQDCDELENVKNAKGEVQGICPNGWHLPSKEEMETLVTAVGISEAGTALKSQKGWELMDGIPAGEDSYGFSALPTGYRPDFGTEVITFSDAGGYAPFWTSSSKNIYRAFTLKMGAGYKNALLDDDTRSNAFSVRCLQNVK